MGIRKGPGGTGWASALENKRAASRSSRALQAGRGLFGGSENSDLAALRGPQAIEPSNRFMGGEASCGRAPVGGRQSAGDLR